MLSGQTLRRTSAALFFEAFLLVTCEGGGRIVGDKNVHPGQGLSMSRTMKLVLLASLVGNLTIVYVGYKAYMYRSYINYWLDKYEVVVEEFSGRHHYLPANATYHVEAPRPNRVVFLGTQVVSRWDVAAAFPQWEAINRGIEGQRVAGFLLRFRSDVIALKPGVVVIEISSYNFRSQWEVAEIREYAQSMADLARFNGMVPVFGTVIPPRTGAVDLGDYKIMDSVAVFNEWLRAGAQAGEWRLVEFNELLADEKGYLRKDLSADGIDPNEAGYAVMGAALDSVLAEIRTTSMAARPAEGR